MMYIKFSQKGQNYFNRRILYKMNRFGFMVLTNPFQDFFIFHVVFNYFSFYWFWGFSMFQGFNLAKKGQKKRKDQSINVTQSLKIEEKRKEVHSEEYLNMCQRLNNIEGKIHAIKERNKQIKQKTAQNLLKYKKKSEKSIPDSKKVQILSAIKNKRQQYAKSLDRTQSSTILDGKSLKATTKTETQLISSEFSSAKKISNSACREERSRVVSEKKEKLRKTLQSVIVRETKSKTPKKYELSFSLVRKDSYYISSILKSSQFSKSQALKHIQMNIYYSLCCKKLGNISIPDEDLPSLKLNLRRKHAQKVKTIVFDLDETLIHCNENNFTSYHEKCWIKFNDGSGAIAQINIRPYAKEILQKLSKKFELIIFTASESEYANEVIDLLDPEKQYISHRLYRNHCIKIKNSFYVKDLRILNRNLENVVLVDNAAYSYAAQPHNGIPILPYFQGSNDCELKNLEGYLNQLEQVKDVRQKNRRTFKLHRYHEFQNAESLVEALYQN